MRKLGNFRCMLRVGLALLLCVGWFFSFKVVNAATTSGSCGSNVTWKYDEVSKTLTISGSGTMRNYGKETFPWYSFKDDIQNVVFENGVKSIGNYSFYDCTGIKNVVVPDSVTKIGYNSFTGCSSLKEFKIPYGVTAVETGTFWKCEKLAKVEMPDTITSIGWSAFDGCMSLTEIRIPDGVTNIDKYAFDECTGLTEIKIPNSVTTIGERAFYGCTGLNEIKIPDAVTNIGKYAFYGCTAVTGIEISTSVTSIGEYAFSRCTALTEITIPGGVKNIEHHICWENSSLKKVVIMDGVTSIGESAFKSCRALTEVTIPSTVKSISKDVFYGCSNLNKINLSCKWRPDIESGNFYGAKNISTVNYIHLGKIGFIADDVADTISLVCEACGNLGTVTLIAPDANKKIVYDGTVKTAKYTGTISGETPVITYAGDAATNGKAINAGTYTAYMAVGGQQVSVEFQIEKIDWAPNAPVDIMSVPYIYTTVRDVELPQNWIWQKDDVERELVVGEGISATAIYNGTDKGNYKNEAVTVTITRAECTHEGGVATCIEKATCDVCGEKYGELDTANHGEKELCNRSDATCTEIGYTGDTCCKDCGFVFAVGEAIAAKGHEYSSAITKEPTIKETGVLTYTCVKCSDTYTEVLDKLPDPAKGVTAQIANATYWGDGGEVVITLTNGGEDFIGGWNLELDLNIKGELTNSWGDGYVTSFTDGHVTIKNQDWVQNFEAGTTKTIYLQYKGDIPEFVTCTQNGNVLVADINYLNHWGYGGQMEILVENTGATLTDGWTSDLTINHMGMLTGSWGEGLVTSYDNGHMIISNQEWKAGFEAGTKKSIWLQFDGNLPVEAFNLVVW